jgi:hypothetical protein
MPFRAGPSLWEVGRPHGADSDNFTFRLNPGTECHERVEAGAYVPGKWKRLGSFR